MVMSAISLPSPDVAAGLLMMAFADFGDNNEAGKRSLKMMNVQRRRRLISYRAMDVHRHGVANGARAWPASRAQLP